MLSSRCLRALLRDENPKTELMSDNLLLFVSFRTWGGRVFASLSNSSSVFVLTKDCRRSSRRFGSWEELNFRFVSDEVLFGGSSSVFGLLKLFQFFTISLRKLFFRTSMMCFSEDSRFSYSTVDWTPDCCKRVSLEFSPFCVFFLSLFFLLNSSAARKTFAVAFSFLFLWRISL